MRSLMRLGVVTCAVLALPAAARAEVVNCTEISSVPFEVTEPGIYCLNASREASLPFGGVAIRISADDVVFDLNGHTLAASGPTTAVGVFAGDQKNVTVRNGTVRGFGSAVALGGFTTASQGHIIEDVRAEGSSGFGIRVVGTGSIARRNLVIRTGGPSGGSSGIIALGSAVHVVDNEVVETVEAAGQQAIAINVGNAPGAVVERNVVTNAEFGPSDSVGIFLSPTCPNARIVGNHVTKMRKGLFLGSTALYRDNTVAGATTAFTGGIAAGATNFSF
jgi:hypothetical protein